MMQRHSGKMLQVALGVGILLCLFLVNSPFSEAEQTKSAEILFIIANQADESPISGIEIEIFRNIDGGTPGEKVGNFISQKDKTGEGLMNISLAPGDYLYRVVTEEYRLTGEGEWETFRIEGRDSAVLLWVRPVGEEMEIKDEEVALGAPKAAFNTERTTEELHAKAEGNHQGFQLNLMHLLDISNNVWLTLGLLAGLILGVIGLDYLIRIRNR